MTLAPTAPPLTESTLLLRVLSAFIREDVVGLRSRTHVAAEADGEWLVLAADAAPVARIPVEPDGFQARHRARLPFIETCLDGSGAAVERLVCLDDVLATLARHADPCDRDGFAAYAEECRQTLATMELHEATWTDVADRLSRRHGPDPAQWTGLSGSLGFDALAARVDHPVYPTARGRAGLEQAQLLAYAPEFGEPFALRWLLLPAGSVHFGQGAPHSELPGLPTATDLGGRADEVALPVHPLTVGPALEAALQQAGVAGARLVPETALEVIPTLSMRTVARADRPAEHIKLPLATATLGLRNRRSIKPGTLVDGVAGQRLVEAVLDREPRLRDRVLVADETAWAHSGHELLATLVRRYPTGLGRSVVVPLAAFLALAPEGRLVIDHLARRFAGGDVARLLDGVWDVLLDLQVTLFTYGIALESHQQNLSVVLDDHRPPRLLLKDNDGPRVNRARLRELGLDRWEFDDQRTWASDESLADMVATITVHLCGGAFAFALAERTEGPVPGLLDLLRHRVEVAVDRPGAELLRTRLLEDDELPVKAMVTAGTLLSKARSGAADVNKHYTTGPNYLRAARGGAR